jgi:metallo-beta-lactamase family protein
MDITFLGATGTVTGSKYLVTSASSRILIDCGLFQGLKQLRLRNREPLPFEASGIHAVVLTHAHLDHSGFLPVLVRDGFRGPIYCTPATRDLCEILLPDSGHLQEEDAAFANRHGHSRHHPALPLYTEAEAEESLRYLSVLHFGQSLQLPGGLDLRLHPAGHILGAAIACLDSPAGMVVFSGDLGRARDPLLPAPTRIMHADHLVVESTYGDRRHVEIDPLVALEDIIKRTAGRGGVLLIPSFAVGRTQSLLYLIHQLKQSQRIPELPVFLDSPMAARATRIFKAHPEGHRLDSASAEAVCSVARPVETVADSKAVDAMSYPRIVISASGMLTGGRVLHHLKVFAPDPRNTILLVGHQAVGTRGAAMLAGARSVKVHGSYVPVRAEIAVLENFSAHADSDEILEWLESFKSAPRTTFITHGEPVAADALRHRIEESLGWHCRVPEYRERVELR